MQKAKEETDKAEGRAKGLRSKLAIAHKAQSETSAEVTGFHDKLKEERTRARQVKVYSMSLILYIIFTFHI